MVLNESQLVQRLISGLVLLPMLLYSLFAVPSVHTMLVVSNPLHYGLQPSIAEPSLEELADISSVPTMLLVSFLRWR